MGRSTGAAGLEKRERQKLVFTKQINPLEGGKKAKPEKELHKEVEETEKLCFY